jgi:hypothetical protein
VLAKRRPRRLRKDKRVSYQTDSCARYALIAVERLVEIHATPPFSKRPVGNDLSSYVRPMVGEYINLSKRTRYP